MYADEKMDMDDFYDFLYVVTYDSCNESQADWFRWCRQGYIQDSHLFEMPFISILPLEEEYISNS